MIKRVLGMLMVLLVVFAASRLIVRALPGDPLNTLLAETGTSIPPEELARELGLDQPFFPALWQDLLRALKGDWGASILTREPVAGVLLARLARTAQLTALSILIGLSVSLCLGLAAAGFPDRRWGRFADRLCTGYGAVSSALPTVWIGPMMIYTFAVVVPLFPVSGHIALPALTLAIGFTGFWSRLIRERVRETLRFGAAPGARARGLSETRIVIKYGLAPASGALAAFLGTQVGALLGGAFVTEAIFDWPGIGSLLVDSVLKRDYPLVEGAVFVAAAASLLGTAAGDLAQSRMDPRGAQE